MATILAGNSVNITLTAGKTLVLNGNGQIYVSTSKIDGSIRIFEFTNNGTIGPFATPVSLYIRSISGDTTYSNYKVDNSATTALYADDGSWIGVLDDAGREQLVPALKRFNAKGSVALGQQYQTAASPTFDGRTWHMGLMSECAYAAVRVVVRNNEAAGYTLDGANVASSTTISSVTPTGTWTSVTWDGATSIAIPARTASGRPSVTYSDWINVTGVQQLTGRALFPCHIRFYIATGPFSVSGANTALTEIAPNVANALGRYVFTFNKTGGNYATTNQTGFTTPSATNLSPSLELEFLSTTGVLNVMGIGDSIMHGVGGTTSLTSYAHYAIRNTSSTGLPIFWKNYAVPSTTSAQFLVRLQDAITAGDRPDVLLYSPFTPNDGTPDVFTIAAQRFRLVQVLNICKQYGIIPLIVTSVPNTAAAWDAAADNLRKAFDIEMLAMANKSTFVADISTPLSNGATPARYATTMTTDGTHPNDAGHLASYPPVAAQLKNIASYLAMIA